MNAHGELPSPAWQDRAACRNHKHPERFYSLGAIHPDAARLCATCPVRRQCLDYVMAVEGEATTVMYRFGVWGGTTAKDRAQMARDRKAGAA